MEQVNASVDGRHNVTITIRQIPVVEWMLRSAMSTPSGEQPRLEGNALSFRTADYQAVWNRLGDAIEHGLNEEDDAFWRAAENIRRKLDPTYKPN